VGIGIGGLVCGAFSSASESLAVSAVHAAMRPEVVKDPSGVANLSS
jgi:hypothetical protein